MTATVCGAATLTITPPVIFDCSNGLATATLTWSGATGPVEITVGQPNGTALTGFASPSGSTITGNWVIDGMTFYLVDQAGLTEASAVAQVSCGGTPRTIDQGLSNGSYFPLAVGNTWVYKYNDRSVTASYLIQAITGTQTAGSMIYFVLTQTSPAQTTTMLLRGDDNGVIWQSTSSGDQVYLDPNAPGTQQVGYAGPLGSFSNAVMPPAQVIASLNRVTSIFVRGIGLVNQQSNLMEGSSGGFNSGFDLVDVRVDGVHLSVPAPKLSLAIEATDLDLTHQLAPNCAVPCYFVACGLVVGTDPPNTYRPCAQARIDSFASQPGYTVLLQLLSPAGTSLFQSSAAAGLDYIRIPLYIPTTGNGFTLLPPGDYTLSATLRAAGATLAFSNLTVHIQ